jgi:DNA polymerase
MLWIYLARGLNISGINKTSQEVFILNTLELLKEEYEAIVRKELQTDSRIVFGDGNERAEIVLVGEAPGEKEEETGRPFVGAAGKNLDEFLDIVKLKREDIYITNVVKIRPYKVSPETGRKSNRPPNKKEVDISIDTLDKQLDFIKPKIVVTLGNVPLKALLGDDNAKIGDYHGKTVVLKEFILFPLYHPASIIYKKSLYDTYIEDVNNLKSYIEERHIGGK